MFINRRAVLILLAATTTVDSFSVVPNCNSVAFAPRTTTCENTFALFSEVESETEAPAVVEEPEIPEAEAVVVEEPVAEEEEEAVTEEEEAPAAPEEEDSDEFKIYIGNMVFEYGYNEVEALFKPYGAIKDIKVPPNKVTSQYRGYAFVSMATQEDGLAAIEALNNKEVEGRVLKVIEQLPREELERIKAERPPQEKKPKWRQYDGTKIYVGNLPFDTENEELSAMFEPYGEVSDCFIPLDRNDGRPRGFAFITMSEENAKAAIEGLNGIEFGGRDIVVNESRPRTETSPSSSSSSPSQRNTTRRLKLYVGNVSFQTEEEQLTDLFSDYGEIMDIYAPVDQETGRPRGFAFITMEAEAAAQAMNECDGYELDGRILRVNEAQAKGAKKRNFDDDYSSNDGGYGDDEGDDDSWGNDDDDTY